MSFHPQLKGCAGNSYVSFLFGRTKDTLSKSFRWIKTIPHVGNNWRETMQAPWNCCRFVSRKKSLNQGSECGKFLEVWYWERNKQNCTKAQGICDLPQQRPQLATWWWPLRVVPSWDRACKDSWKGNVTTSMDNFSKGVISKESSWELANESSCPEGRSALCPHNAP